MYLGFRIQIISRVTLDSSCSSTKNTSFNVGVFFKSQEVYIRATEGVCRIWIDSSEMAEGHQSKETHSKPTCS